MPELTEAQQYVMDMCMDSHARGMRDGFTGTINALDAACLMIPEDSPEHSGMLLAVELLRKVQSEREKKEEPNE